MRGSASVLALAVFLLAGIAAPAIVAIKITISRLRF